MSTVETAPAIHTHKSNFGRYVADCPKCAEKYPNGPPDRKMIRRHVPSAAEKRAAMEAEIRVQVEAELRAKLIEEIWKDEERMTNAVVTRELKEGVAAAQATAATSGTMLTGEQLVHIIQELRRPDPEVEAKKAADKLRDEINKQNERQVIAERLAFVAAEQNACNHRMQNGVSRVRGQEHGDGMLHEFCTWCQKAFPPRVITAQERAARASV